MSKPLKPKPKNAGITFPAILAPNTGIHILDQFTEKRYKIWYHVDGRKRYVLLPRGLAIEEARTRRDTLYRNLKKLYGARKRTPKPESSRPKPRQVDLTRCSCVYKRPESWIIKVRGKYVGEARTQALAEKKRDAWLEKNAKELVPN